MKKILYTIGLCLLAASCSDDYKDWGNPLSNAQEALAKPFPATAVAAIDVKDLTDESVQFFTSELASQYDEVDYTITLYNADSTKTATSALRNCKLPSAPSTVSSPQSAPCPSPSLPSSRTRA